MTKLHFQDKSAADLFKSITPANPTTSAEYFRYVDGPVVVDADEKFKLRLNTRVGVQTPNAYNHIDVVPQDWLTEWVWQEMGSIVPDWYYLTVVARADGNLLFLVKYNKILGSRWLRMFAPCELPDAWLEAIFQCRSGCPFEAVPIAERPEHDCKTEIEG